MNKKQVKVLIVVVVVVVLIALVVMFGTSALSGVHRIPVH